MIRHHESRYPVRREALDDEGLDEKLILAYSTKLSLHFYKQAISPDRWFQFLDRN